MKKLIVCVLLIVLCVSVFPAPASASPQEINVYNWGQYISDGSDGYIDVNAAFTEATGIKVNYVTYDSNETLYTKLKTGGSSIDVIFPSDYMVARLAEEGMLEELDYSNIPNYALVDEAYKNTTFDPDNKYSVPYTWGTMGIIYNDKFVDEEDLGGWELLWNEKYAGKILMYDNPRDSFGIAQLELGISINSQDPDELRAATYLLLEQKPLVQEYVMDQIYDKMEREEAWIAPYYAGDYLQMAENNEHLQYYFPEEGFNLFIDACCIPKGCSNKSGAEAYINFLLDPEISGQNLEYLGYSTPILAAKEYMDPEAVDSEIAYPDEETLNRGSAYINLPEDTLQLMDSLWLDVKTSGGIDKGYAICLTSFAVIVASCVIVSRSTKKRRKARRCQAWKENGSK